MRPSRDARLLPAAAGTMLALALAACGHAGPVEATDPDADGWRTIAYDGVRVDIPTGWDRADTDDCEFPYERWAPPGVGACSGSGGVWFYRSATFDPADGPGLRRGDTSTGEAAWAGYVYAGDLAVYASDDDRGLLGHLLRSVRTGG